MSTAATTSSTSTVRGFALAVVVATVAASIGNAVISFVAQALGVNATYVMGLNPPVFIAFTLIGTILGAIGWLVIRKRSANPAALLKWLVPVVVVVSLVPDLLIAPLAGWGALALALMHPVVATAAVFSFNKFLPLPR